MASAYAVEAQHRKRAAGASRSLRNIAYVRSVAVSAVLIFPPRPWSRRSAIPSVEVQYAFTATAFDLDDGTGGDAEITGDTLSRVDIEYGLMGRYKFVHNGIAAQRNSERTGNRPYMARWIIGFAFKGGSKQPAARSRS